MIDCMKKANECKQLNELVYFRRKLIFGKNGNYPIQHNPEKSDRIKKSSKRFHLILFVYICYKTSRY